MNNSMERKGVSPILSWILIIAFSIAMAMIIIPAMVENARNIVPKPNIEYCDDVRLSLGNLTPNIWRTQNYNGTLNIYLRNTGSFSIHKLTIGRITSVKSQQWCEYSNFSYYNFSATRFSGPMPLKPGESQLIKLNIDKNYYFNITSEGFTECDLCDPPAPVTDSMIAEIELVPWIKIEDDIIQCDNKKLILKDTTVLNTVYNM